MLIRLTAARLEELNACPEVIADFRSMFGEQVEIDWTPEKQREILLGPLRKWFSWGWQRHLFPVWNLSGADLSGAYLSGAYLSGADLGGTKTCLCDSRPCVALREFLEQAGWTPGADSLLSARPVAPITAQED
ncbi:MAG: pentapeptide repeat-containing protein [Planctomycetaceae bacterium]|nr:pentapeptide repeat-containing protein [Planctomycetaceae bacterium]